jgi:signal transduction histidine kinase
MRLQFRISLAAGAVLAIVASTVGGISLANSYGDAVQTIDSQLERMAIEIKTTKPITVTSALDVLSANGERPILAVFDSEGQSTVLSDDMDDTYAGLNKATLFIANDLPQTFFGKSPIRIRSIPIQNEEVIVIGLNLSNVYEIRERQQRQLWTVVLTSALLGWAMIGLLIRPELARIRKLIVSVSEVADGNLSLQIPDVRGRSEVVELSRALKQMLNKLQLAIDSERQSQEKMMIFFGDVSHELRTPLTVIKGYAELLEKTQQSGSELENRGFVQMRNEIARMEVLIDDLMLLNELHMDEYVDSKGECVILNELINQHLEKLSMLQPERYLERNLEEIVEVTCERTHIERLFTNLFSNIHRHTPNNAPVAVSLSSSSSHFIITIDDGGPGLPKGTYARGINHFQRFDKSRSRQTGGSGLGMSIIAALVEKLDGEIEISQSPLGGLQTRISLPHN